MIGRPIDCVAQGLRHLERDGFVARTHYDEVPPRVEYEAPGLALSLRPLLAALGQWAEEYGGEIAAARAACTGPLVA